MKNFIKKMLFGDYEPRQYLTLSIKENEVKERAFLHLDKQIIGISQKHFTLCQNPYMIGVWLDKNIKEKEKVAVEIQLSNKPILRSQCRLNEIIEFKQGNLWLLELVKTQYYFINSLHQKAVIGFFYWNQKHKVSFEELDHFCAMYSYPRSVILTCFGTPDDYNLFPMDLRGCIDEAGLYFLGLRNTNVTLKKMLAAKKVVVCGIASDQKKNILSLGAHHSTQPPSIEKLPFDFIASEKFGFPIPAIIMDYRELEIQQSLDKGSHTIMICKIVNKVVFQKEFASLHHQHIVPALKLGCSYTQI